MNGYQNQSAGIPTTAYDFTSDDPSPSSPIASAIDVLSARHEGLLHALRLLEKRLSPVLTLPPPEKDCGGNSAPISCELEGVLLNSTRSASAAESMVHSMINRLAL